MTRPRDHRRLPGEPTARRRRQAQLTLLPSVVAGRKKKVLVLARPEIDLGDVGPRRPVAAQTKKAGKPQGQGQPETPPAGPRAQPREYQGSTHTLVTCCRLVEDPRASPFARYERPLGPPFS